MTAFGEPMRRTATTGHEYSLGPVIKYRTDPGRLKAVQMRAINLKIVRLASA
jgi:hypothetical protein